MLAYITIMYSELLPVRKIAYELPWCTVMINGVL